MRICKPSVTVAEPSPVASTESVPPSHAKNAYGTGSSWLVRTTGCGEAEGSGGEARARRRIRDAPSAREGPATTAPAPSANAARKFRSTALVVAVQEPAVDGRATGAVLEAVAKALDLPRSRVRLRSGDRSRDKLLTIIDPPADLAQRLAALRGGAGA